MFAARGLTEERIRKAIEVSCKMAEVRKAQEEKQVEDLATELGLCYKCYQDQYIMKSAELKSFIGKISYDEEQRYRLIKHAQKVMHETYLKRVAREFKLSLE
jgi:hypothetical protein